MLHLAWKNLRQDLTRMLLSIGGVAASVLLILALQGVFAGSAKQIAIYIDQSNADLIAAQSGVKNMHMANSVIPLNLLEKVARVSGVDKVEPVAFFPAR